MHVAIRALVLRADRHTMQWIVTYAKVTDDKQKGIVLSGIYFVAVCESERDASEIARECSHVIKNGMIIPKTAPMKSKEDFKDTLYDLYEQYHLMCESMTRANNIYNKTKK